MKIVWLSHLVPYPPRSGVAQRSYGLLCELARRHEVVLLAFHQKALMDSMSNDPEAALADAVTHLRSICAAVEIFDINWERSPLHKYALALTSLVRRHPYSVNWLESKKFASVLRQFGHGNADLVHFDTISLAIFRDVIGETPCVLNHHNIESHLLARRSRKSGPGLQRAYYRQEARRLMSFERAVSHRFDLHVTCSDLDRTRLLDISPDSTVCVIPNGVDLSFFTAARRPALAPTFTFVGSLGWGPNRDAAETIVNDIWPALSAAWPDAKFSLIGANPPEHALDLAKASPNRFAVSGFVEDVRPFIEEAAFFICPIRDGGGTKLKILNAMAMGRVVIADPVAMEGIDAAHQRHAIFARDPEEYVRAVRTLLENPELYSSIASEARRLIESKYSYEVIGVELDRRYRALSAGPGVA